MRFNFINSFCQFPINLFAKVRNGLAQAYNSVANSNARKWIIGTATPGIINAVCNAIFGLLMIWELDALRKEDGLSFRYFLAMVAGSLNIVNGVLNLTLLVSQSELRHISPRLLQWRVNIAKGLGIIAPVATVFKFICALPDALQQEKEEEPSLAVIKIGADLVFISLIVVTSGILYTLQLTPAEEPDLRYGMRKETLLRVNNLNVVSKSYWPKRDKLGLYFSESLTLAIAIKISSSLFNFASNTAKFYLTLGGVVAHFLNTWFMFKLVAQCEYPPDLISRCANPPDLIVNDAWRAEVLKCRDLVGTFFLHTLLPSVTGGIALASLSNNLSAPSIEKFICNDHCSRGISCSYYLQHKNEFPDLESFPMQMAKYNLYKKFISCLSAVNLGSGLPVTLIILCLGAKVWQLIYEWKGWAPERDEGFLKSLWHFACCDPKDSKFSIMRTLNNAALLAIIGFITQVFILKALPLLESDDVLYCNSQQLEADQARYGCFLSEVLDQVSLLKSSNVFAANADTTLTITAVGALALALTNFGRLIHNCGNNSVSFFRHLFHAENSPKTLANRIPDEERPLLPPEQREQTAQQLPLLHRAYSVIGLMGMRGSSRQSPAHAPNSHVIRADLRESYNDDGAGVGSGR